MSSDGNHDLAFKYPTGAYPDSPPATRSESAADIATAFHNMSIHTPARLSPNGATAQAKEVVYAVSFPSETVIRDAHHFSLAQGATTGGSMTSGPTQLQPTQSRVHTSNEQSDNEDDLSICPICTSEQAYCHCPATSLHTSPPPLPIPPQTSSPQHMGQIELNREQAEALVARLTASLDTHHENPVMVSREREPPPEYPEGSRGVAPELAAQGVEVLDIPVGGRQN
jgi:hypothetical protein